MATSTADISPTVIRSGIEFEDILLDRRKNSDLRFAAQEWEASVSYKFKKKQTKEDVLAKVARSDKVLHTISQLVANGEDEKALEKKVSSTLLQMSHNLNIATIRRFALLLPKIMKKIYGQIFVNCSGVNKLKAVIPDTPVVLLPSHRSYADFLLVSYLSYHYHLPFPVIAAGMDFMSMALIGDMLRSSGAFYIKRSFVDDELYWAIFQEYVQALVCDSGHPLEFFLEGTRSRSGKCLPPKKGLLCCAIECWLRGKVPDLMIVPISISYNRTLEERLYAYEMLGVPKPKESTSGLLKAMRILKEDFGDIYVNFGDPISVSAWMGPLVDRHVVSTCPLHLSSLSKQELDACDRFSVSLLREMQHNSILSVWSLTCVGLMRSLWDGDIGGAMSPRTLLASTVDLVHLAKRFGATVEKSQYPSHVEEQFQKLFSMHKNVIALRDDGSVIVKELHQYQTQRQTSGLQFKDSTVAAAIKHLFLQHYVNQALHVFVRPALVAFILSVAPDKRMRLEELLLRYSMVSSIFSNDFIFEKELEEKDVLDSLRVLCEIGECELNGGTNYRLICESSQSISSTLIALLNPFRLCYQGALSVAKGKEVWKSEAELVMTIQPFLEASAELQSMYSALSLDACRQSVKMMLKMGALRKEKSDDKTFLIPDSSQIENLKSVLSPSLLINDYLQPKL